MAARRMYRNVLGERAARMVVELRTDPATEFGAIVRVAEQLGMHAGTLRGWVLQAEVDDGVRPGTTSAETGRIARFKQENRELPRAHHILNTTSAFFAAKLHRPTTS